MKQITDRLVLMEPEIKKEIEANERQKTKIYFDKFSVEWNEAVSRLRKSGVDLSKIKLGCTLEK